MWHAPPQRARSTSRSARGARSSRRSRTSGSSSSTRSTTASFKQEEGVRYHARDMAILRAHRAAASCVLGSATPSLESEHLARTGQGDEDSSCPIARARRSCRRSRSSISAASAPGPTGDRRISASCSTARSRQTLAAKEQTILFLNRRGFAPSVRCEGCGELASCPHCTVALTFHSGAAASMRCHWCDYEAPMPERCKKCGADRIALEGLGTEKLEETLARGVPRGADRAARPRRRERQGRREDPRPRPRARGRHPRRHADGHEGPRSPARHAGRRDQRRRRALDARLPRRASAPSSCSSRSPGRAGRGERPGAVLVQTYDPEHHAIRFARAVTT